MRRAERPSCPTEHTALQKHSQVHPSTRKIRVMLTAAKEGTFSASSDPCVFFPLAADGVCQKTRVWGSKPENVHCSRAIGPLKVELRWGCDGSSVKTAVGSGVNFKYDPAGRGTGAADDPAQPALHGGEGRADHSGMFMRGSLLG
jgi:hypothetical protein